MSTEREQRTTELVVKEDRERMHRAKETALDVAIGGPALAVEKASEAVDELAERGGQAARRALREARTLAAEATAGVRRAVEEGQPGARAYEERTRDELYALAAERKVPGRSKMRKTELIEALRD